MKITIKSGRTEIVFEEASVETAFPLVAAGYKGESKKRYDALILAIKEMALMVDMMNAGSLADNAKPPVINQPQPEKRA